MTLSTQKIKDVVFHNKLACIYYPEEGAVEIKLFGCRLMRIKFPPGTPIQFSFRYSDKTTA